MQKWENTTIVAAIRDEDGVAPANQTVDKLNQLGRKGWELVSCMKSPSESIKLGDSFYGVTRFYLKRPLS